MSNHCLGLARALAVTANDLDLIHRDRLVILHLEGNVFDQEGPDLVAETVGIQMAL